MSDDDKPWGLTDLRVIDVDATSAERIAHRARADLGHSPSPARWLEPVLIALFSTGLFAWALVKVFEVFR